MPAHRVATRTRSSDVVVQSTLQAPGNTALQRSAQAAYELCGVAPPVARDAAETVLAEADADPVAAVMAMRALGLATRHLSGPGEAVAILRAAIRKGERHRLERATGQARITYAAVLAELGRMPAALAECEKAARMLHGLDAGPLLAQRALILSRAGRTDEALADYNRALPLLRKAGDVTFLCRVHQNRANVLTYLGYLNAAERDIVTALDLARAHGLRSFAQALTENLGFVKARHGDVPAALRYYADVEDSAPYPIFTVTRDRAEALLQAGLADEARQSLEHHIDDLVNAGFAADATEWYALLAQAALIEGDAIAAQSFAKRAAAQFHHQRRSGWAHLAKHLEIRARWAAGERSGALARAARDAHARLAAAGWQVAALHCLLVAGRTELDNGRVQRARTDLAKAARARLRGPADLRAEAWYAEALLRIAAADTRGAMAALRAGLKVVDEHAATLGATDLRVHASGLGSDLAHEGLRLAVESGKPVSVLEWSERFRAGALRRRPARPPSDNKLASDLAELRRVTAELAQATATGSDSRALLAQQQQLEEAIRQRSRHASAEQGTTRRFDVGELHDALGERALVEIVRTGDEMRAVTAINGRLRLHQLGGYQESLKELESVRFSLHRLARRHGSAASLDAAQSALHHAAARLEELLLRPILGMVIDRELVIVPTGDLHALPWPTLPGLRGRPLSVVPSATTWLSAMRAARRGRRVGDTVLVAGPGLDHASSEIRLLAKLYDTPNVLTGKKAVADDVRQAIDGADLVHIAAHGRFRADNPQFSAIDLADGPLTVYDLERIRRAPRRIVLSACDSGLSAVHPGDELMGLAGALFALGTSTLIASVVPVADDLTESLMVEMHRELCTGRSPSLALAAAQERVHADGFVCFGAS